MSTNKLYIKCTFDGSGDQDYYLGAKGKNLRLTTFAEKHIWIQHFHLNSDSLFQLQHLHTQGNYISSSKKRFRAVINKRKAWLIENTAEQLLVNTSLSESRFLGIRKSDDKMFWINEGNISQGFSKVYCELIFPSGENS
jgi:hypothetical protein